MIFLGVSMESNKSWAPNIGIKPGNGIFFSDICPILEKHFDFIEYQAPLIHFKKNFKDKNVRKFRPHSNKLSIADENGIHAKTWKKLKEEVKWTNALYLGEHIGSLNPMGKGPSLGYLFPPEFTINSAKAIVKNVKKMQGEITIPIALENPMIYSIPLNAEFSLLNYMLYLDEQLPRETGWLIDLAHLYASCLNIGENFEDILKFYKSSKRRVYEVHLCNVKVDKNGVFHDDHHSLFSHSKETIKFLLMALIRHGLCPENITIERDIQKNSIEEAIKDLAFLKRLIKSQDMAFKLSNFTILPPASVELRTQAEKKGRQKILLKQLQKQTSSLSDKKIKEASIVLGYKNTDELLSGFYDFLREDTSSFFVSVFGNNGEYDGIDLLSYFIRFLVNKNDQKNKMLNSLIRELIIDSAILAISWQSNHHKNPNKSLYVFIETSGDSKNLGSSGFYQVSINYKTDDIEVEKFDSSLASTLWGQEGLSVFLFSEKGGLKWNLLRKEHYEKDQVKLPSSHLMAAAIKPVLAVGDGL